MFPVYLPSVRYGPGAAKVPEVQYKFTLYSIDSVRTDLQHNDAAFSKLFTAVSILVRTCLIPLYSSILSH